MTSNNNQVIKNYTWDNYPADINWIKINDDKYQYLKNNLINRTFPLLVSADKTILLNGLIKVLNLMRIKFGEVNDENLYHQLVQNDLLDLRAILAMMLPYISDEVDGKVDEKKHQLKKLEDIYLKVNSDGSYVYTNSQYNRCIRHMDKTGHITYSFRPFLKEYFDDHLELLLMSIDMVSNKLYVNWIDVLPVKMNKYQNMELYKQTKMKIMGETMIDNKQPYTNLKKKFDLLHNLNWSELDKNDIREFSEKWNKFLNSNNKKENTILFYFYLFFARNYKYKDRLITEGKLIEPIEPIESGDMDIKTESIQNAKEGLKGVPIRDIYTFIQSRNNSFDIFVNQKIKGTGKINASLINNYIDPNPGVSYQDIYNVVSNHLYDQIKNIKWLIYDIIIDDKPLTYIVYLEKLLDLKSIWSNKRWPQLELDEINLFTNQWKKFLDSFDINDNTILLHFYFFFTKYHRNSSKLIQDGKLILTKDIIDQDNKEDDDEDNIIITPDLTRDAKVGLLNVPVEEIYLFLYDQLESFQKTWFYYLIKIKKQMYVNEDKKSQIYITPKNIYNYAKSLISYVNENKKYVQGSKLWYSLKPPIINMFLIRILDIENTQNNWSKSNWFNINKYIKRLYPNIADYRLLSVNYSMHKLIKEKLVDVIFESMIYNGLLSEFVPNKALTDSAIIALNNNNENDKEKYLWSQMKKQFFSGQNKEDYGSNAYYFVTQNIMTN